MCHYKWEQKNQKAKNKKKNKKTKEKQRSKPLIAVLEEVVKMSGIILESHQRGSWV